MPSRSSIKGVVQLRRSGWTQETSLDKQLDWAIDEARRRGVPLDATHDDLCHMQKHGLSQYKAIHLDDAKQGDDLSRTGLTSLFERVMTDRSISHVFAFKQDRMGRPEIASEMVAMESKLRLDGVALVFQGKFLAPANGQGIEISDDIISLVNYHSSHQFLIDLAEQMVFTKNRLAKDGYSGGGRAPYGFQRALFDPATGEYEILPDGRSVKHGNRHVVWVPGDPEKIGHWLKMPELKEKGWGYKRIATWMNDQSIPSPDAGRTRTDHGVEHPVSGLWNGSTVKHLLENRAILGIIDVGRRSEGKKRRTGLNGPRHLEDGDYNEERKPKRIRNPKEVVSSGELPFEPLFDRDRWEAIQKTAGERSRKQAGIPKAKDPARYPLSCLVMDLNCGSMMHARTVGKRAIYRCGAYMNSGPTACDCNTVDGEAMLAFVLRSLRDQIETFGGREALEQRIRAIAEAESADEPIVDNKKLIAQAKAEVTKLKSNVAMATKNLMLEDDEELKADMKQQYSDLKRELAEAKERLNKLTEVTAVSRSNDEEVERALALYDEIMRVTNDPDARKDIQPLLASIGLNVGLNFTEGTKGPKRKVRELQSGVIAFNNSLFEQELGRGGSRHGRDESELGRKEKTPTSASRSTNKPREGISYTKGNRGGQI